MKFLRPQMRKCIFQFLQFIPVQTRSEKQGVKTAKSFLTKKIGSPLSSMSPSFVAPPQFQSAMFPAWYSKSKVYSFRSADACHLRILFFQFFKYEGWCILFSLESEIYSSYHSNENRQYNIRRILPVEIFIHYKYSILHNNNT